MIGKIVPEKVVFCPAGHILFQSEYKSRQIYGRSVGVVKFDPDRQKELFPT
ncbi:MAG: hypothetical protein ACI8PB_003492 [Desulforhopalus sp.]|jgi:hypothetical protein